MIGAPVIVGSDDGRVVIVLGDDRRGARGTTLARGHSVTSSARPGARGGTMMTMIDAMGTMIDAGGAMSSDDDGARHGGHHGASR